MTTIEENLMEISANTPESSNEKCHCIPEQLVEAYKLLKSLNRKLENCALERQAGISREQWKILNSKPAEEIPDRSLLMRTYFIGEGQDAAFQHLISCNKIFTDSFTNLMSLLQGEQSVLPGKETRDAQSQWSNGSSILDASEESTSLLPGRYYLTSSGNQRVTKSKNSESITHKAKSLRNSFADVIKAKVNFDTKFLGFEAVLHKTASGSVANECFCPCCEIIPQNAKIRRRKVKNTKKRKRLARSPRTVTKGRRKRKSDVPTGDVGNHPEISVN